MGPTKLEKPTKQKTMIAQDEEKRKKEEADRKEVWQSIEWKKEKEVPAKHWDQREINVKHVTNVWFHAVFNRCFSISNKNLPAMRTVMEHFQYATHQTCQHHNHFRI